MHPQPLRRIIRRQSARGLNGEEQRAEHRGDERVLVERREHRAVDGTRNLNQRGHELLLADEHRIVDAEIRLLCGGSMLQRPAFGRIRIRIRAGLDTRLACALAVARAETTPGRIGVLVAHMQLAVRRTHLALHDVQIHPDAARRLARIQVTLRTIANLGDERRHSLHRAHLPGGIRGVEPANRGIDHKIIQRLRMLDQRAHRLIATVDAQIARVEIVVGNGDERLRQERRIQSERVQRGLLPRGIAIEREHDARAQCLPGNVQRADQLHRAQRIIGDQPPHDLRVLGAERRAARRHRRIDAGQMHRHDIGVTFDDDDLTLLHDGRLRQVDAVQHLRLTVQLGVRRVDVLRGDLIVVIQLARAKAERAPGRITNRPCGAAGEIVVHAALPLPRKPGVKHLLLRKPLGRKIANQIVPPLRRVPAAETLAVRPAEIASAEQLARGQSLLAHDLRHEKTLSLLVGLDQPGPLRPGMLGAPTGILVMQLDMVFVGEKLHRLAEIDVLLMLNVAEHVAAETAAETMPHAQRRPHGETRRLLVMERAQADERAGAGRPQRHARGHDVVQVRGGAHLLHVFLQNHSSHSPPV